MDDGIRLKINNFDSKVNKFNKEMISLNFKWKLK